MALASTDTEMKSNADEEQERTGVVKTVEIPVGMDAAPAAATGSAAAPHDGSNSGGHKSQAEAKEDLAKVAQNLREDASEGWCFVAMAVGFGCACDKQHSRSQRTGILVVSSR